MRRSCNDGEWPAWIWALTLSCLAQNMCWVTQEKNGWESDQPGPVPSLHGRLHIPSHCPNTDVTRLWSSHTPYLPCSISKVQRSRHPSPTSCQRKCVMVAAGETPRLLLAHVCPYYDFCSWVSGPSSLCLLPSGLTQLYLPLLRRGFQSALVKLDLATEIF